MEAYCVKCKAKREMRDPTPVFMTNGRPATRGHCPECDTGLFRIGHTPAHDELDHPLLGGLTGDPLVLEDQPPALFWHDGRTQLLFDRTGGRGPDPPPVATLDRPAGQELRRVEGVGRHGLGDGRSQSKGQHESQTAGGGSTHLSLL